MASGHVNRTQRPNTWLHRPSLQREDSPCQLGAVHTWHITSIRCPLSMENQTNSASELMSGYDRCCRKRLEKIAEQ